jgi:diguanylate cyclase (GGDEF)-like protein
MPELDLQNAITLAERLRKAVVNNLFPLKDNTGEDAVTISLGFAVIKSGEELSPEKLIKKADDALFVSQRNGRNQVSVSR